MTFEYADLIGVPYKERGRGLGGMDCYGLVLECCARMGKPMRDVMYNDCALELAKEHAPTLNVRKSNQDFAGALVEMRCQDELHIGVSLGNGTFLHATRAQGVRVSRLGVFPIINYYEVI